MELGVVDPGELVDFLFELFVVEMAAAGRFLGPFPGKDGVLGVLQFLDLNCLR